MKIKLPHPIKAFKQKVSNTQLWYKEKKNQIKVVIQAIKDIRLLFLITSEQTNIQNAFIAYTFIVGLSSPIVYELMGLAFKYDFVEIFKNIFL